MITGGEGQLGLALRRVFSRRGEVRAPDLPGLDVTRRDDVMRYVDRFHPDVVIHAAAFTDVDRCEKESETAFRVNEEGSRHVAEAAREGGARLVAVSTDFVFDGRKKTPYAESDRPAPLNVYGASKLAGERAVIESVPGAAIVRTAWLYGPGGTGNFVRSIVAAARSGREMRVVDDQVGSPTLTGDLAEAIHSLVERRGEGVYHVVNAGEATRYDLARAVLDLIGLADVPIERIDSFRLDLAAARPANSALACSRLAELGVPPLRHWREALEEHLTGEETGDV